MTNEATKIIALGKNIQKARKMNNLSQNELAEKLDISREHLAKVETAKRCISLKLLFKVAEVLKIQEKDLFDFE
ncbi:MAG: helix-turn-helix transcriptional regulator [Candidatus Gastranaerophilales bacterium]|nr:helix-turn-helix transcriptional regulator [Candidatus Gastranaerophilales bacterium]